MRIAIRDLEHEYWTPEVGLDINDPIADAYSIVPTTNGLCLLMNSTKPYAGWLAKQVSPLLVKADHITFCYTLMIDGATLVAAQVIETDFKITDDEGWTYDLSAQWLIGNKSADYAPNWMFQVDEDTTTDDGKHFWKWRDTNITIQPLEPYQEYQIRIDAFLNYADKTSSILAVTVDDIRYDIDPDYWIEAFQEGWAVMEIVTQLQQCNNDKPGGYELMFCEIGYELET